MIHLKSPQEIDDMHVGGAMLAQVIDETAAYVRPGMTTKEIDTFATKLIKKLGGDISFNKVPGYHWATCLCVNEQIVHTPPSDRVVKEGDVLTIDAGVFYKGLHTDKATTILVGSSFSNPPILQSPNPPNNLPHFLESGREILNAALKQVKPGNRIGHLSQVIDELAQKKNIYIIRDLTGHGVGHELHEDPLVPGYVDRKLEKTPLIEPGMVLAIEIIYAQKRAHIMPEKGSDWSLITSNHSIAACFEDTIAVLQNSASILTRKYGKI